MSKRDISILETLSFLRPGLLVWMLGASLLEALFVLGIRDLLLSRFSSAKTNFTLSVSLQSSLVCLLIIVLSRTFFQWRFHKGACFLSVRKMQALRQSILNFRSREKGPLYRDPGLETFRKEMLQQLPLYQKGTLAFFQSQSAALQLFFFCLLLPLFPPPYFFGLFLIALPAAHFSKFRTTYLRKTHYKQDIASGKSMMLIERYLAKLEFLIPSGFFEAQNKSLEKNLVEKEKSLIHWETAQAFFPALMEGFYFAGLSGLFAGLYVFSPASLQNPEIIAFGALMLLMYKPLRDWTRSYPQWIQAREFEKRVGKNMQTEIPKNIWIKKTGSDIEIKGLRFGYRTNQYIWCHLNLNWNVHDFCCLSAPNGWGKSTLLKIICGLESPEEGNIWISDSLWENEKPAFFYLPQRAQLSAAHLDLLHHYADCFPERYMELCDILQIENILSPYVANPARNWEEIWGLQERLSGGQTQRVCLAAAFACDEKYLLLDEPSTWLPGNSRVQIMRDLLKFRSRNGGKKRSPGLLCVTHEEDLKALFSHQLLAGSIAGQKK